MLTRRIAPATTSVPLPRLDPEAPSPGESLVEQPPAPAAGSESGRRIARMLLLRTIVISIVLGLSMFVLSKVGQIGVPPNPQTKMMVYFMPIMMTVLFLNFASGLNLYYAAQNIFSIPQQYLIAKKRLRQAPVAGVRSPPPKT